MDLYLWAELRLSPWYLKTRMSSQCNKFHQVVLRKQISKTSEEVSISESSLWDLVGTDQQFTFNRGTGFCLSVAVQEKASMDIEARTLYTYFTLHFLRASGQKPSAGCWQVWSYILLPSEHAVCLCRCIVHCRELCWNPPW